jgi:peptidoglycan/LPS O-acetylase OafA/YrhL
MKCLLFSQPVNAVCIVLRQARIPRTYRHRGIRVSVNAVEKAQRTGSKHIFVRNSANPVRRTPRLNIDAKSSRIPELGGIRGVAIAAVLALHFITDSSGGDFGSFLHRFKSAFRLGWSGVDLFFVLSGFLIGSILLASRNSNTYYSTFYIRRSLRILPIYLVWLLLYVFVAITTSHVGIFPNEKWAIWAKLPYYVPFLQTFVTWPILSLGHYWLSPMWSLAIEEHFYLAVAPTVRHLSTKALAIISMIVIVASPFLRLLAWHRWGAWSYFVVVFRADALMVGVLLAIIWRDDTMRFKVKAHKRLVHLACLLLALPIPILIKWFPATDARYSSITYSYLAIFFFMVVLSLLVDTETWFAKVARHGSLVELGRISYCVYIVNLGLLGLCHSLILHQLPSIADAPGIGVTLPSLIATLAVAKLSMKYFESRMLTLGKTISPSQPLRETESPVVAILP